MKVRGKILISIIRSTRRYKLKLIAHGKPSEDGVYVEM